MSTVGTSGPGGAVRTFGARLAAAMETHGPLCVGIDPHPALLAAWGLPDDVSGLRAFSRTVLDAVGGHVAALKPQSALFERHGSAGIAVLEELIAAARATETLVILDAKRGDIGSTMAAYADAYLRDGSSLAVDALTVSPYLGFGSLAPAVEAAAASGRGLFVLALTSNPEGAEVQHARDGGGVAVAARIAAYAGELNAREVAVSGAAMGSVGLVVGATTGAAAHHLGIDLTAVKGPLLAPGVGAQGAGPTELRGVFGDARGTVLASSSRGVLAAGPDRASLLAAARSAADQARSALS
ncbi:MAG: orotidine-5'-phosphate decarboxylase [Cellulomonas sp.]